MKYPGDDLLVKEKRCVLLLSGGLDSAVSLELLMRNGWEVAALQMDYGQKHWRAEMVAASAIAAMHDVPLHVFTMPSLPSPLTTEKDPAPKTLEELRKAGTEDDHFVVPGRNGMFLSIAVAYAQANDIGYVFLGSTLEDVAAYPDCRPEFLEHWTELSELQGRRVEVRSILAQARKEDVIQIGMDLNPSLVALTVSCYHGNGCGRCPACMVREEGFHNRGLVDPAGEKS